MACEDLLSESAKADDDLQKSADKAIAELRPGLDRSKEIWEQARITIGVVYRDQLCRRSKEGSAILEFWKDQNAARDIYITAVEEANERIGTIKTEKSHLREVEGYRIS